MTNGGARPEESGSRDGSSSDDAASFDELRRRIYAPGVSPVDLARYRAAAEPRERGVADLVSPARSDADDGPVGAAPVDAPPVPRGGRGDRPGCRRRRLVAVGVVVLLVLSTALAAVAVQRATVRDVPLTVVAITAAERTEFLQNLARGEIAGLGRYVGRHPGRAAARAATGDFPLESAGAGPTTVMITAPSPGPGRITVLLVLATGAPVRWSMLRTARDADGRTHSVVLARRVGPLLSGALATMTIASPAHGGPDRVRIDVPYGVRWGTAIVYDS